MDLEILRKEVAKKKQLKREREEEKRLKQELYELDNPDIIEKQKLKAQRSAKIRKGIVKFIKGARSSIAESAKYLNKQRSPKAVSQRLKTIHGINSQRGNRKNKSFGIYQDSDFSLMGTPSKSKQSEFSLI